MKAKITYSQVGDNYSTKDPINKLSQDGAKSTSKNLKKAGFEEVVETRGDQAFVWKQGNIFMASVIECLGTKNLIADEMRKINGKSYYDNIASNTVATFINDLSTVGAKPLVVHAYWAVENNDWLHDRERMSDLINGWSQACNEAGATWGGGETPTMRGILMPNTVDLAGSAVGIIKDGKKLITDSKLKEGDRIVFIRSNGINANGVSLARMVAKKLPKGYATQMPSGQTYGDGLLTKSNLYANLVQDLLESGIDIHYITHITGHGLRKIMRARTPYSYIIEKVFEPHEIFSYIKQSANLTDEDCFDTFNMGQDYAIFMPEKDVKKALGIVKKNKFEGLDAGCVKKGKRQVVIEPKNIVFASETLDIK